MDNSGPVAEWREYGGDKGGLKFSPLTQITPANVDSLTPAWEYRHGDVSEGSATETKTSFLATPVVADGSMFFCTAFSRVIALDPETGEERWTFDPELRTRSSEGPYPLSCRGVAYWGGAANADSGTCQRRVYVGTRDSELIALDAASGEPCADFGKGGRVSLRERIGEAPPWEYYPTSPPLVVRDVVVLGQSMSDTFVTKEAARGDVRAFDVRTGRLRWQFHTVPQAGERGTETWDDDSWQYTGHAPVWSLFSADEELGYVYMPISSATSDMYGGHRGGDNLFSQSLVCVDATTGERVWHFQLVHHGLWDYDPPTAPILMDITVDGRAIKAVTQLTKQAFAYVFDRVTGEPVWPIEERPVPQSETPGERTSATQPFPTKPPAFDRQGATVDNLIDFTPELREEALEIASRYTMGPLFTPPTIVSADPTGNQGTVQLPGSQGGADVQGAGFDPETGYLYIPSITAPFVADLGAGNPDRTNLRYIKGERRWIAGPRGLPLFKPPYGRVTAIDMNRGDIVWQVANGDGPRNHPAIRHLNLGPLGYQGRPSPLVTKTLLLLGESGGYTPGGGRMPDDMPVEYSPNYGGPAFKAYDKATGEIVWETELPAGTTGNPISYLHEGTQYIVVAIGSAELGPEFIALALP